MPAARDAAWLRLRQRFERGVDWSGLERERVARWYRQLHIFMYPFYYIEYGIAQVGALQVWRNSLQRPERRGGPLPRGAGPGRGARAARRSTGPPGPSSPSMWRKIGELVKLVESEIERVRAEVPGLTGLAAPVASRLARDKIPRRPAPVRAVRAVFSQRRSWMAKEEGIEMEGVVTEVLPDRNYRVMLENGHEILAYAAGKMSKFKIRVLEGDRVSVVLSPYDLTRGRVIYRHK